MAKASLTWEAAREIGVSVDTLRRWERDGKPRGARRAQPAPGPA
jgi:DNA-binding transcriptional MerR regulator